MVKKVRAINTTRHVNKTGYKAKIKDIDDKIPSITNLAISAALSTVKNKIPDVSILVKKADYNEKIKDIENKYFISSK